jgi:hypothetical protein
MAELCLIGILVASGAEWKPAIFRTIMSLWVSYRWTVVLQ